MKSRKGSPFRLFRRWALIALLIALALLGSASAILAARIDVVSLPETADDGDTTFLMIGTDAGVLRPVGDLQESGARADVVVIARVGAEGAAAVVIPRDLVVDDADGAPTRLALTMADGVPGVAGAICRTLGVGIDHALAIDADGFTRAVDALGGVDVDIPVAVRDPAAGLLIEEPGRHHLSGAQTLALARSRHPEHLIDGTWVTVDEQTGAQVRAESSGQVADALAAAARDADGLHLLAAIWEASDALTISSGTMPWDLSDLTTPTTSVLPTTPLAPGFAAISEDSRRILEEAGFDLECADARAAITP